MSILNGRYQPNQGCRGRPLVRVPVILSMVFALLMCLAFVQPVSAADCPDGRQPGLLRKRIGTARGGDADAFPGSDDQIGRDVDTATVVVADRRSNRSGRLGHEGERVRIPRDRNERWERAPMRLFPFRLGRRYRRHIRPRTVGRTESARRGSAADGPLAHIHIR